MIIGSKDIGKRNHTYVCGILNITQDSFSDGGKFYSLDKALFRAEEMSKEGALLLDVGGESTRPGFTPVSPDEEMSRVIPVIEAIKSNLDIAVSVDTTKAEVALESVKHKVDIINTVQGLSLDEKMAKVIAESGRICILTHNGNGKSYVNFQEDFFSEMAYMTDNALKFGISEDRIIVDPGIGFFKSTEENLYILNNLDKLKLLGTPYLLGASRKSVIGNVLSLDIDNRLEGTLATTAMAVINGAAFVRVHDVKENVRFIQMMEAILNG